MFGYVIGGVLTTNFGPQHFRTAFVIQALLLLPFGVAAMFIDPANMDACPDDGVRMAPLARVMPYPAP